MTRPFMHTCFCVVKGLHCLYQMQASVASQLEDAKGQTQPELRKKDLQRGLTEGQRRDYRTDREKGEGVLAP
jgi:hypothetical protein